MSKGSVYPNISIIERVITIWDEVFCKLGVFIDVLVIRKKVFSDSSHLIEIHLDVFVKVLEFQIRVSFDLCLDEELIEFW